MATLFRNAAVALDRAKKDPTPLNIQAAIYWCGREYAYGGSMASMEMLKEARVLANKVDD